jgi:hypothetical protein
VEEALGGLHRAGRRAAILLAAAVVLVMVSTPATAATGPGSRAYVSTRIDDPADSLSRAGNVHMVQVGVDVNPEGVAVSGDITSYDCEPGQLLGDCDRVSLHRLASTGVASVSVHPDGHAEVTAEVAELRARDGRQLRVIDVDLTVGTGNLTLRQNCECTFTGPDGVTYVQRMFVKQWTGGTASGSIGVFEVEPGPATSATSGKYWVKSSSILA